jgi:p38 MAP kinase
MTPPGPPPAPLSSHLPSLDADAVDLLSKMLVFDPKKRITAAQV